MNSIFGLVGYSGGALSLKFGTILSFTPIYLKFARGFQKFRAGVTSPILLRNTLFINFYCGASLIQVKGTAYHRIRETISLNQLKNWIFIRDLIFIQKRTHLQFIFYILLLIDFLSFLCRMQLSWHCWAKLFWRRLIKFSPSALYPLFSYPTANISL